MRARNKTGYTKATALANVPEDTDVINLSTELTPVYKWNDGKPTNEVIGYRILCGMPDNYFSVKFTKKVKVPAYKASIKFTNLEACEVNGNVWFRADDVEEA